MFARVLMTALLPTVALAQTFSVEAPIATELYSTTATDPASAAIWPHPTDPGRSLLLISDPAAGLLGSPLDGGAMIPLGGGSYSGVSVRENFPLAGAQVTLISAAQRDAGVVQLFTLDQDLEGTMLGEVEPDSSGQLFGTTVLLLPNGERFLFVSVGSSAIDQFRLGELSDGGLSGEFVRSLTFSSRVSQLQSDIANGALITTEDFGTWRVAFSADGGMSDQMIASSASFSAPLGATAVYPVRGDAGYLLLATPSTNTFHVLQNNSSFGLLGSREAAEASTGFVANAPSAIAVFNRAAGPFDAGVLALEDRVDDTARFLLVPWQNVANSFDPPLAVDSFATQPDGGVNVPDAGEDGGGGGNVGGELPGGGPKGGAFPEPEEKPTGCGCQSTPTASALLLVACLAGLFVSRRRQS